jgi:hypothetical protein
LSKVLIKFLFTLIFLGSLSYGIWRVADSHPELKDQLIQHLPTQGFSILEPRFTASQIMENEKNSSANETPPSFGDYAIIFHPFALMEVKFSHSNQRTGEGIILWDLIDGEMVLNTETWEKSHGFADCIHVHADPHELKVITAIARQGNQVDRRTLSQLIHVEGALLDTWLDRCVKKKLLVCSQGQYRIHLESPLLAFTPVTKTHFPLITKQSKHPEKLKKHFSLSQVARVAEAAFGEDFAIRQTHEVFLPIYSITLQNLDGSSEATYWNGLNGKKIFIH